MSSTSAPAPIITGTAAGAHVPFTEAWVQGSTTTTYTLVGQILDNGHTNFVGYDSGDAFYLLTTSADGAAQTTLANGMSYYVTSGSAPTGYIATGGSGGDMTTGDSSAAPTATPSGDGSSESSSSAGDNPSSSSSNETPSGTQSAASSTSSSSSQRISVISVGVVVNAIVALMYGTMA